MSEWMDLDSSIWDRFDISSLKANKLSLVLNDATPSSHREWRQSVFMFLDVAFENLFSEVITDDVHRLGVTYFPVSGLKAQLAYAFAISTTTSSGFKVFVFDCIWRIWRYGMKAHPKVSISIH